MADSGSNAPERQHDFDIQKDVHRKIRNDPDYDDWEYGTEPLPHEKLEALYWRKRRGVSGNASRLNPPISSHSPKPCCSLCSIHRPAAAG